jgi:hypothetical protein
VTAARTPARCIAPVGDDDLVCGCVATTTRTVEGIVCPLCDEHARELDAEKATDS